MHRPTDDRRLQQVTQSAGAQRRAGGHPGLLDGFTRQEESPGTPAPS